LKPELIDCANDELAHRARRDKSSLRSDRPNPGRSMAIRVHSAGQARPDRLWGKDALRPWAQQHLVTVSQFTFNEVNRESVDRSKCRLRWKVANC